MFVHRAASVRTQMDRWKPYVKVAMLDNINRMNKKQLVCPVFPANMKLLIESNAMNAQSKRIKMNLVSLPAKRVHKDEDHKQKEVLHALVVFQENLNR